MPSIRDVAKKMPLAVSLYRRGRRYHEYWTYVRDFRRFRGMADDRFPVAWRSRAPCLGERTAQTHFDRHYVYHTAWAARVLARTRPVEHVDISSSLYFVSIVSAFIDVRHIDYRPPNLRLSGLTCEGGDILSLPFADASVISLSCMHVVEHIGLGRYGDPLRPDGDLGAICELTRVLAPGGNLLFVVPTGSPSVYFNAHRVYSYGYIREYFAELDLVEFSLIPDDTKEGLIERADPRLADEQEYGCGCYWFRKPDTPR